jgi:KDO2-lipid IV(A) lauroyltransferase
MRIILIGLSWLPFWYLHLVSRVIYAIVYLGIGYRRKVVRENLRKSFPEQTEAWRLNVERKFYKNFCDQIIESIKTTTITLEELQSRCVFTGVTNAERWFTEGVNVNGISSHLANWEWLPLTLAPSSKQNCFGIYKPLSNKKINAFMIKTRERFGLKMIPIKESRTFFESKQEVPYVMGLLSDQAPHDYSKAFEFEFLNQKSYFVAGPGVLTVKYNLKPTVSWMRRTGRSRYEWSLEALEVDASYALTEPDLAQIARISKAHDLSLVDSERAFRIVKEFARILEMQIRSAPADWLWTHRRWKTR